MTDTLRNIVASRIASRQTDGRYIRDAALVIADTQQEEECAYALTLHSTQDQRDKVRVGLHRIDAIAHDNLTRIRMIDDLMFAFACEIANTTH